MTSPHLFHKRFQHSLFLSYCTMASPQCLTSTRYHHHLHHFQQPINNLSPEVVSFMSCSLINSMNNSTITSSTTKTTKRRRTQKLKVIKSSVTEVLKQTDEGVEKKERRVRILIAGGGIGGLVMALAAKERGFEVMVFEKNLSAVRGEGRYRGPIQLMSSALGVLVGIHEGVAKQVMNAGCVTADRNNGLVDGVSGYRLADFDLLAPATKRGLPLTLVISRITLQEILLKAVGDDIVFNNSKVVDISQDPHKVVATLDDGRQFEGDILVGADGIWSEVRKKLFGAHEASYSGYTCYSGLANYVPSCTKPIGYRVFLGTNRYFAVSDVGNGKMQWYAFHKEPQINNGTPAEHEAKKVRLKDLFGSWCSDVTTLIAKTNEEMIIRRDIYDRDMIYSWGTGRVTLLGDAAHPLQPNLGLGGCLAIEDCRQLIDELESMTKKYDYGAIKSYDIASALKRYEQKRMLRTMIVHGVTRMASTSLTPSFYIFFKIGFTIFHAMVGNWSSYRTVCHQRTFY